MNRTRNIKEVRGRWADLRRAEYLLEREIERSYKKDPVGAEMLTRMVLEPMRRMLDALDGPISEGEDQELATNLAGLNNMSEALMRRKLNALLGYYIPRMAERDIEVTLVEKRIVYAKLVEKGA